jgi:NADH:ubiquinone oxidoreductase subunit 5 (subunit L)/multisubunit Na+/H+ antiporter MnhA subunit
VSPDGLYGAVVRETVNFTWFRFGSSTVDLGWVLDPLSAIMLVMVSFVGLLIFIYSTGYMAHDENFTRFFCFLSLFAGAMLGVVISNSLLLLFMCWEIVGLTSYLLIGFWYQKPSAAAAAKKAFVTTRVGDVFFLLGIVWLFSQTGTLLFYNHGVGSLEGSRSSTCSRSTRRWASPPPAPSACSSSPEPRARAASFLCTSGCPTPWKAPRPSPRSFTRPPWSQPASF